MSEHLRLAKPLPPAFALTVQFRRRGDRYEPVNPDAKLLAALAGMKVLPPSKMVLIDALRYRIELV